MNPFSVAARTLGVLPLLGATLLLGGCGVGGGVSAIREIARIGQEARQIQERSGVLPMTDVTTGEATPLAPDEAAIQLALQNNSVPQITAANSGPGLIVCEPLISGAQAGSTPGASAANFGAGCGRWLHLSAAGLPQFGKTPSWYGFDYALREMGKSDGRINQKEAAQLAKILAVTHVATGELKGSQTGSTLTYHLWKLPEQKEVGAPLVLRGNRAQIAAGLPGVAKSLAARLKGDASLVPAKTEVSAPELELIGAAPRQTEFPLDAGAAQKLKALAARSPVAGVEYLAHLSAVESATDTIAATQNTEKMARTLHAQSPQNTLVLAQITSFAAQVLAKSPTRQSLVAHFPNNYLIAYSESVQQNLRGNRAAQKQAALRAIAASPQSAWAWLQLEFALAEETRDIRHGRYMSQMTFAERRAISALYPQMSQASLQAIRCDPLNAEAWNRLSYSEAAGGSDDLAEAAFWKSISLPARKDDTYDWGLELFQAKWQGNANKLGRVARCIATDKQRFLRMSGDIAQAFSDSGWQAQAKQVAKWASAAHESWLAVHPTDTRSRYEYAQTLQKSGDASGAAKQFGLVVKQQPQNVSAFYQLALLAEDQRNWKLAAQNYEQVLALVPTHRSALYRCGQAYHEARQFKKAEPLYLKAIALYPDYAEPYNRLGDLHFFVKHDKKGAEKLYRTAIQLDPSDQMYRTNLQRCLGS
jgi:tetratricopeptide (TPR) repeat protein